MCGLWAVHVGATRVCYARPLRTRMVPCGASPLQLLNRDNLHRCKLACMGSWVHWVTSVAYQKAPKPVMLYLYHVRKLWYHHRRLEIEL